MRRIWLLLLLPVAAALALSLLVNPIDSQANHQGGGGDGDRARDPGVRGGMPGAGGPLAGLSSTEQAFFELGLEDFNEAEDVADDEP